LNFKTRWHDIVKRPNDAAINDACSIRQVEHSRYHIATGAHVNGNYLTVDTAEGVDLMLEEFYVKDEGWKKVQ
jgi:hypothetical protein